MLFQLYFIQISQFKFELFLLFYTNYPAMGVNFLKIGALIPVLEYFTTKRMKALVLSRVGTALGGLVTMGFMFVGGIKWRTVFR
jgi:hypothetical protein